MKPTELPLILASVALAAARVVGVTAPADQAAAHLFVGGWFGAWLVDRRPLWSCLALGLTAVESACVLADRFR